MDRLSAVFFPKQVSASEANEMEVNIYKTLKMLFLFNRKNGLECCVS